MPPSTGITWPVMYDACSASEAMKTNLTGDFVGLGPPFERDAVHHVGRELLVGTDGFRHRCGGQRCQGVDRGVRSPARARDLVMPIRPAWAAE